MIQFQQQIDSIFDTHVQYANHAKATTVADRKTVLIKLEQAILMHQSMIEAALMADLGKHPVEVGATEIFPVLSEIRLFRRKLKRWTKPKSVRNNLLFIGSKASVVPEPKGVCLIISPWNYPFQLALINLVAAVAAGNTVILKPSEFVPAVNKVIKQIIEDVFPVNWVTLVEGEIEETTYLLTKKFHHIHFTGSPAVGKVVMTAAAKNLTSVTLELGGKSPLIIDETVDLRKMMPKILWGKMINNGQTCIAPDYVLIQRNQEHAFIEAFKATVEELLSPNFSDVARLINPKQWERLTNYIGDAKRRGAIVVAGGEAHMDSLSIEPTLITNVNEEMLVMKEELFGPIFPMMVYDHLAEVVAYIQNHEKPLVCYMLSHSKINQELIRRQTSSGALLINDFLVHVMHPNLPFGGVNHSGMGQSTGYFGFLTFSHQKAVLQTNAYLSISTFLNFPYTDSKRRLIKLFMQYF